MRSPAFEARLAFGAKIIEAMDYVTLGNLLGAIRDRARLLAADVGNDYPEDFYVQAAQDVRASGDFT